MPKVMIGVPTAEFARRADFYDYLTALEKPEGTLMMTAHGQSPAKNRNAIIEKALEQECSHILFLDDDLVFESNILVKLLAHDKDIVSGLYLMRNYPHYPVLFDEAYDDGRCRFMLLKDKTGLVEIVNCGFGLVLINTKVFEGSFKNPWVTLGEIEQDGWCDDLPFFNKIRKNGYKLYCDLDVRAGHMLNVTMWPHKTESNWNTSYVTHTGQAFQFPQMESYPELTGK